MRLKRSAWRLCVNTNAVTFLYRLQIKHLRSQNSKIECFSFKFLCSIWNILGSHDANLICKQSVTTVKISLHLSIESPHPAPIFLHFDNEKLCRYLVDHLQTYHHSFSDHDDHVLNFLHYLRNHQSTSVAYPLDDIEYPETSPSPSISHEDCDLSAMKCNKIIHRQF